MSVLCPQTLNGSDVVGLRVSVVEKTSAALKTFTALPQSAVTKAAVSILKVEVKPREEQKELDASQAASENPSDGAVPDGAEPPGKKGRASAVARGSEDKDPLQEAVNGHPTVALG